MLSFVIRNAQNLALLDTIYEICCVESHQNVIE